MALCTYLWLLFLLSRVYSQNAQWFSRGSTLNQAQTNAAWPGSANLSVPLAPWDNNWQPEGQWAINMTIPPPSCPEADQCWSNQNCESCLQYDVNGRLQLKSNTPQCQTFLKDYPELVQMIQCEDAHTQATSYNSREQCAIDKRYALCKDPRSPAAQVDCTKPNGTAGPIPMPLATSFGLRIRRAMAEAEMRHRRKRADPLPSGTTPIFSDSCQRLKNFKCQNVYHQCQATTDPCETQRWQDQDTLNRKTAQLLKDADRRYVDCMDRLEWAVAARSPIVPRKR